MTAVTERRLMMRAIRLANLGLYTTDPNPRVGCVITNAAGEIIGEGWHQYAGQAHAEINALKEVARIAGHQDHSTNLQESQTEDIKTADIPHTAYVTLEPCCHQGKTGPCTQALISAGLSRVVIAMLDPNPMVAGQGVKELEAAGIQTQTGLLQDQAEALNPGFIKRMRAGLPWVRVKTAMSLDGRTALASGESQWITGEHARRDGHRLRARSTAILTGIGTVLHDDPSLNARLGDATDIKQPLRVVLDSSLRTPPRAALFAKAADVIIYTGDGVCAAEPEKSRALLESGAQIHEVALQNSTLDLRQVLAHLARQYEINEILVEAGATLCGALIDAEVVDELVCYIAPSLLGHEARAAFVLPGIDTMRQKIELQDMHTRMVGDDLRITATVKYKR